MRSLAAGITAFALIGLAPSLASGQSSLIEFGVDGALSIALENPRVTTIGIPVQQFRVGFFTSSTLSWEPALAIDYVNVEGAGDASRITLQLGALFHRSSIRTRSQVYLRPFGGFTSFSAGGTNTDANIGFGVGFKSPWENRRFATRIEGFLNHLLADPEGITSIGVLFGLSYFTR
jgi:hypothetical protein